MSYFNSKSSATLILFIHADGNKAIELIVGYVLLSWCTGSFVMNSLYLYLDYNLRIEQKKISNVCRTEWLLCLLRLKSIKHLMVR